MSQQDTVALQSVIQFALPPIGTTLVTGEPDTQISWGLVIRAQPSGFPEIYGGELALVSMDVLRSFENRIRIEEVIGTLSKTGVGAIALAMKETIPSEAIQIANTHNIALLTLPQSASLSTLERAINKLILNKTAQITERAIEIQRQLTRLATENRDLNSLIQVIARATAKPVLVHDDAGVLLAQVYPHVQRRSLNGRGLVQNLAYGEFQDWLENESPNTQNIIAKSPIGHTATLQVEKRVAGYLSLVDNTEIIADFDRMVLNYGADVCAIELAKSGAIQSAVEQARGDWIQMWLTGTPADDDLLTPRAQQAGFDVDSQFLLIAFRAITETGQTLPLESHLSMVRDSLSRMKVEATVGQYVDTLVMLYPMDENSQISRIRTSIDEIRTQLASRTPSGLVMSGISRPVLGLSNLRKAYREAKDALNISQQLGETERTTFYGDLKLYQLLLSLKMQTLDPLTDFYHETLEPLVEHDERRQSELIRTLDGFFEANGNLAKAAEDLAVHRNTLVYRLGKIGELTGLDLDDSDNRLILHLALKIQRVLATVPSH